MSLSSPNTLTALAGVPAPVRVPANCTVQVKSSSWPGSPCASENCGILGCRHDYICQANALYCVGHAAAAAVVKVPAFSAMRTLSVCVAQASGH